VICGWLGISGCALVVADSGGIVLQEQYEGSSGQGRSSRRSSSTTGIGPGEAQRVRDCCELRICECGQGSCAAVCESSASVRATPRVRSRCELGGWRSQSHPICGAVMHAMLDVVPVEEANGQRGKMSTRTSMPQLRGVLEFAVARFHIRCAIICCCPSLSDPTKPCGRAPSEGAAKLQVANWRRGR
jgi:hypothetical protein